MVIALSGLLFAIATVAGQEKSDQPPIPLEKWGLEYAAKTWGLKLKSVAYNAREHRYELLVEFSKDLEAKELKTLREAIPQGRGSQSKTLAFYFLDKDKVLIEKRSDFCATSELTGVKGDAFRIGTFGPVSGAKVELRVKQ
jgi:hypothetical protein